MKNVISLFVLLTLLTCLVSCSKDNETLVDQNTTEIVQEETTLKAQCIPYIDVQCGYVTVEYSNACCTGEVIKYLIIDPATGEKINVASSKCSINLSYLGFSCTQLKLVVKHPTHGTSTKYFYPGGFPTGNPFQPCTSC